MPPSRRVTEPAGESVLLSALAEQIEGAHLIGEASVTGLRADSRALTKGELFLAVPGEHHDGHRFAREALRKGAVALCVERVLDLDLPQLVVPSVAAAAGPLASACYGHPSRALEVVGVTGTNGKTTTSQLLRAVLADATSPAAQIGTTGVYHGDDLLIDSALSTPQAPDLQRLLRDLAARGARRVAMEVTSHGLHGHRVDGTHFRLGVFLNLTPEHLDYHGTMEAYFDAKRRLFEPERCVEAVICVDDEWGRRLAATCEVAHTTFGRHSGAQVHVEARSLGLDGLVVDLRGADFEVTISSRLVGRVNANNLAAAFLSARALGIEAEDARRALEACAAPPGRFEVLGTGRDYLAVADYAHTPEALEALVATAREIAPGRVLVVLGARGQRYVDKRPEMALAALGADRVWFTTDSPGDEDPEAILRALLDGVEPSERTRTVVEPDRATAIRSAVRELASGDILLMTGRGPEATQRFAERVVALDDRVVATLELDARREEGASVPLHPTVCVAVLGVGDDEALADSIGSVLAQTHGVAEVVVLDDGSREGTLEVVHAFGPLVRLERHPGLEHSALLNYVALCGSSTWIALLDGFEMWHPRTLEWGLAALRRADVATCTLGPDIGEDWRSVMVRRDVFARVGGFESNDPAPVSTMVARASSLAGVVELDAALVARRPVRGIGETGRLARA